MFNRPSSRIVRRSAAIIAGLSLVATALTSAAFASPGIGVSTNPQAGNIVTDDRGLTLYRYAPDQPNSSTCYDSCAVAWPPVVVDSVPNVADPNLAAGLGVAPRTDGSLQLTYQSQPLYYFIGDRNPGDTTGNGQDGVWFVVNP